MNRRHGMKLSLKGLSDAVRGALARVKLPRLRSGNRRKSGVFTRPLAPQAAGPHAAPAPVGPAVGSPLRRAGRALVAFVRSGPSTAADSEVTRGGWSRRLRALATFFAWAAPLAVAGLAFALPVIGVRAYQYVMTSGYFHVREVLVDGASRVSRQEVLDLAGITPGTHLLKADVEAMEKKLEGSPWVAKARVERDLPDTLIIHLVEHVPAAYLAAGDLFLVDQNGMPFMVAPVDEPQVSFADPQPAASSAEAGDLSPAPASSTAGETSTPLWAAPEPGHAPTTDVAAAALPKLPVVTGIAPEDFADPKQKGRIHQSLTGALNIARMWEAQGLAHRYPLGEIRVDGPRGYVVVIESQAGGTGESHAIEVALGRGPYTEKLYRLEWVLEHLRSQGRSPEYVLLDLPDGDAPKNGEVLGGARVIVKAEVPPEDLSGGASAPADAQPADAQPAAAPHGAPSHAAPPAPARAHAADAPAAPDHRAPPPSAAPDVAPAAEPPSDDGAPDEEPTEARPLSGGRPAEVPSLEE